MKKHVYILIFIFCFVNQLKAQYIYFGMPIEGTEILSGDIIIINEIHWQNSFTTFSSIGIEQLDDINKFLLDNDSFNIQIEVHTFFNNNNEINQKISEAIVEKIKEYLIEKSNNLTYKNVNFIACGSSEPLVSNNFYDVNFYRKINNRIVIKIF